jgi:hypothetical protein
MRFPKQMLVRLLPPVIVIAVTVTVMLTGAAAFSAWREASAPQVGDMIAFRPSGTEVPGKQLSVRTADGRACVLAVGTLRRVGGSFIVESPAQDDHFVVHWAGERTSVGGTNCGSSADIILDARQLELLGVAALASGGQTDAGA